MNTGKYDLVEVEGFFLILLVFMLVPLSVLVSGCVCVWVCQSLCVCVSLTVCVCVCVSVCLSVCLSDCVCVPRIDAWINADTGKDRRTDGQAKFPKYLLLSLRKKLRK